MTSLTPRQSACLSVIVDAMIRNGYPPTLREIGAAMGIRSTNAVHDHLVALERKGALLRTSTPAAMRREHGIRLIDSLSRFQVARAWAKELGYYLIPVEA